MLESRCVLHGEHVQEEHVCRDAGLCLCRARRGRGSQRCARSWPGSWRRWRATRRLAWSCRARPGAPRLPQRARPVSRKGGALPCGAGVLGLSAARQCMHVSARAGHGPCGGRAALGLGYAAGRAPDGIPAGSRQGLDGHQRRPQHLYHAAAAGAWASRQWCTRPRRRAALRAQPHSRRSARSRRWSPARPSTRRWSAACWATGRRTSSRMCARPAASSRRRCARRLQHAR